MEIPLTLKKNKTGSYEYRIAPLFTASSFAICLILLASSCLFGSVSIAGLVFSFLALVGALYTEHWNFDEAEKKITYRSGVYPFCKKVEWCTSDISAVRISAFIKGEIDQRKAESLIAKFDSTISKPALLPFAPELRIRLRLLFELSDGTTLLVDESGIRSRSRFITVGQTFARILSCPFLK